jgi:nitrogen-specific signal transduction histidine kinase/ActR/RegA family two-component response regulator
MSGVQRILSLCRDITERKRAEYDRKRLELKLIEAQKMESIGTLAGGIAHDFNNILSAIIGFSELASDSASDPESVKRDLKEVLKASIRAKDLVSQILTFSRKAEVKYTPIVLRTAIRESFQMLRHVLPSTIEIKQNLPDSGLVLADSTQIHQVILNLCTNAAHAMGEEGGTLEVSLSRVNLFSGEAHDLEVPPGTYLKLSVSDTGLGMTEDILQRIFDPYFTTKEKGRGTGLGLSVVQGIVKSHGGAVTCKSSPGVGTDFNVYLPEIMPEKESTEHQEEKYAIMGTERILFIDDEQVLVDLAKNMLVKMGYDVITSTSSVDALELFRTDPHKFDLVITDTTMPVMAGDKLAQKIMEIRQDIPVILCSGYSEHVSEEYARRIGIRKFVLKPLEMNVFASIIRKVLDEKPV